MGSGKALGGTLVVLSVIGAACGGGHPGATPSTPPDTTASIQSSNFYLRPVECLIGPAVAGAEEVAGPMEACRGNGGLVANTPATKDPSFFAVASSAPSSPNPIRYVLGPADLAGNLVKSVGTVRAAGGYNIVITFTQPGGAALLKLASLQRYQAYDKNRGVTQPASLEAIEVNGLVIAAPIVAAPLEDGTMQFGIGDSPLSQTQASSLADQIRAAASA